MSLSIAKWGNTMVTKPMAHWWKCAVLPKIINWVNVATLQGKITICSQDFKGRTFIRTVFYWFTLVKVYRSKYFFPHCLLLSYLHQGIKREGIMLEDKANLDMGKKAAFWNCAICDKTSLSCMEHEVILKQEEGGGGAIILVAQFNYRLRNRNIYP